jgi:hypothetical protein
VCIAHCGCESLPERRTKTLETKVMVPGPTHSREKEIFRTRGRNGVEKAEEEMRLLAGQGMCGGEMRKTRCGTQFECT